MKLQVGDTLELDSGDIVKLIGQNREAGYGQMIYYCRSTKPEFFEYAWQEDGTPLDGTPTINKITLDV